MRMLALTLAFLTASGAAYAQNAQANPKAQGSNQNAQTQQKPPASAQGQQGIDKARDKMGVNARGRERGQPFVSP